MRDERGRGGDRVGQDLEVLFAVQEEHGGEVGDDVGDLVGGFGGEEGDDAECWEGLEILVAFAGGRLVV